MLELWIFDSDPLLDLLSLLCLACDLLDIVELRHRLLSLFRCLELLVLLDDYISFLELRQLVLDLVLWEWETTNHIEKRGDHFSCQIQLGEAKVFKGSVGGHSILYLG